MRRLIAATSPQLQACAITFVEIDSGIAVTSSAEIRNTRRALSGDNHGYHPYEEEINMRMSGLAGKAAKAAKGDADGVMKIKFSMQGRHTGPCKPDATKAKRAGDY
jgi:hypothetical protein